MKSKILFTIIGILTAVVVLTTARILTFKETARTHYHANFLIYIEGQKMDFNSSKYMEPVSSCVIDDENIKQTAIERVHMHNSIGDLIHVHDDGVTWGHFLENIKYNVGKDFLITDNGKFYGNNESEKLTYILNGERVANVINFEIKSEDRLLINFGSESDETLKTRFNEVPTTAKEENVKNDPATCGGASQTTDFWTKLKKSFLW